MFLINKYYIKILLIFALILLIFIYKIIFKKNAKRERERKNL